MSLTATLVPASTPEPVPPESADARRPDRSRRGDPSARHERGRRSSAHDAWGDTARQSRVSARHMTPHCATAIRTLNSLSPAVFPGDLGWSLHDSPDMARRRRSCRSPERAVPKPRRNFDEPALYPISSGWVPGAGGIIDDVFPDGSDRPAIRLGCLIAIHLVDQRLGRTRRSVHALDVVEGGAALDTLPDDAAGRVLRALFRWGRGEPADRSLEDCVQEALAGEEPSWAADALLRARLEDVKTPGGTREVVANLPLTSPRRIAALRSAAYWARTSGDVAGAERLGAEADDFERRVDPSLVEARHRMHAAMMLFHSRPEEARPLLDGVLSLAARFTTDREPSVVPCTLVALAWLSWNGHDRETARSHLAQALTILRPDDRLGRGVVYAALAQTACVPGDHRAEITWLRKWAAIERPFDRIRPLMDLDEALQEVGDLDEAVRVREELRDLLERLPSRERVSRLNRLADSRRHAGDRPGAFELARQALWLGTTNEHRQESSLARLASLWSMSATLHAASPNAKVVNTAGVVDTSVRPDDSKWALKAWTELRRFEERCLGGPRIDTMTALARLAWDGGDFLSAGDLLLHPGSVDPPDARKRRPFTEELVGFAKAAIERGQPGLAGRLLNRALEWARKDGDTEMANTCKRALVAIPVHG
jgi:hypothetical protein